MKILGKTDQEETSVSLDTFVHRLCPGWACPTGLEPTRLTRGPSQEFCPMWGQIPNNPGIRPTTYLVGSNSKKKNLGIPPNIGTIRDFFSDLTEVGCRFGLGV